MALEKELESIREKFHYDEELMEMVQKAFLGMATYYGSYGYFDQVYHLFLNVQIIPYNIGPASFLEKENLMRLYSSKKEEDIQNHTLVESGELLTKVEENKLTHTVIIRKYGDHIKLSTLIHEMIHGLVTSSFLLEEDGKTYLQSGISRKYFTPIEYTTYHSIEEGFTEYETKAICERMNYDYQEAYSSELDYVSTIMSYPYVKELITKTRVEGIDYLHLVEDIKLKNSLQQFINSYEHISSLDWNQRNELISLNKESVQKVFDETNEKSL